MQERFLTFAYDPETNNRNIDTLLMEMQRRHPELALGASNEVDLERQAILLHFVRILHERQALQSAGEHPSLGGFGIPLAHPIPLRIVADGLEHALEPALAALNAKSIRHTSAPPDPASRASRGRRPGARSPWPSRP